jgi:hypothetical protein
MPETAYTIYLFAYEACNGTVLEGFPMPTATLSTGPSGNGSASFVFPAEALLPFSGLTVGAQWAAMVEDVVVYETECTTVTID